MAVKWTNRMNLPQAFVNAITTDNHVVNGDISVTQLIDAPQIRQLKKTNDYEMDILDMVGMMVGTGFHDYIEKLSFSSNYRARVLEEASGILKGLGEDKGANWMLKLIEEKFKGEINDDVVMEQTLSMEVDGMVLSGTFDRFTKSTGLLEDYKTTSANSMMFPEMKQSYKTQLNIYAILLKENGYDVQAARIIAVLKDHSKMKIMQNRDYPREPIVMMDVPILDYDTVMKFIRSRVKLHKRADAGEIILCTKKDTWSKADIFKVKKVGGKKSLRNLPTEAMAKTYIDENAHKYKEGELWIDHIEPEPFRCAKGYCSMASVCPQYRKEREKAAEAAQDM